MWLWIFGVLVILAVWVIWLLFPPAEPGGTEFLPFWLAVTITVVIIGALVGLWLMRRIRAARAARALEKAIAQQAQEQALNAKPEEREEIQALYKQIAEGINALKASKLGGGMRGDQALYALPWYAIVGPPGAGKTTALRHSGLEFPFLDPSGGGVRGVGGTRNCDWWFTNQAILLDTAGRYTTESDDNDEWVAFLEQLMKYRPEKPLNGVLVAISVSELLDATDDQIKQLSDKVRTRIDEMQSTLKMRLPVYVLFTKSDLVAGFTEYFGDLRKSDRGQPWGATYRLDENATEPGKSFDREFDVLVQQLHVRVTKRLGGERSRANRERIYQFPLEFAAIKRPLQDFMQETFSPSAGDGKPALLRGFYFTSGTQEGKPLDRVVGAMGRAFGLKGSINEESEASKESKSYFLRDVFLKVVFPDQEIASVSDLELRRRLLQRVAIAAAAVFLALVFMGPAIYSYLNNRELVANSERISAAAAQVNWSDGTSSVQKVQKLDEMRAEIEKLKDWRDNGKPISYSWFMYQGNTLLDALVKQYQSTLSEGFLKPTKGRLDEKLEQVQGREYLRDYNNLKTYLLLADVGRLSDPELEKWEAARLTQVWAEVLLPSSELAEDDLKAKLFPHVQLYVRLLRDKQIPAVTPDTRLVESARESLRTADQTRAYYELFVLARVDEKIDETGPNSAENLKYPPISLLNTFFDRPELLGKSGILDSKRNMVEGKYAEVRGPFTNEGFKVINNLLDDEGVKLLEREAWVVPYDADEATMKDKVQKALRRVRRQYEDDYLSEWEAFFRDVDVKIPETNPEAIKEYKLLATPDWAYRRLLQTLSDNVMCPDPSKSKVPGALTADGGVIDQIQKRVERRFTAQTGVRVDELSADRDMTSDERICRHFKSMVAFGVEQPFVPPPATSDNPKPTPKTPPDPELGKYIGHLELISSEMQILEEGPPNTETKNATELFSKAVKESEQMLLKMDRTGQQLMEPLLMNPLRQGYKAFIKGAGGAASGLWQVMVYPHYRDKIKDRYPFNVSAKRDASYEDAVAFFRPKDGILWGFYDKYLTNFHLQQDHDFIPLAHLQGAVKTGKPFTPFRGALYPCLKRADEITDALWPGRGGDAPGVSFQINLKTVSPIVSDVLFEVDGQERLYRNEKEFWYEFKWPGEERRGARIQVRGAGGLDEEIVRDGPWGIFRLFETADKMTASKDEDGMFLVTWTMSAPPVSVTMQVKPRRGNHPFPLSFFRNMNCPPDIGDKFGGQKEAKN